MRGLIALIASASGGGSLILPILGMNVGYVTPDEMATFITATSDFDADLGPYDRALTDAWLEERTQKDAR